MLRLFEQKIDPKDMETKINDTEKTLKQIAKQIGILNSKNKWYRNDIKMNSPYNRSKTKKNIKECFNLI